MTTVTPRSLGMALAGCWLALSLASTAVADAPSSASPPPAAQATDAPAPAATPAADKSATTTATDAVADDPRICKKSPVTGSRVRTTKVCMKKSEWEAAAQASQEYMKGIQRSGAGQPGGEGLTPGG